MMIMINKVGKENKEDNYPLKVTQIVRYFSQDNFYNHCKYINLPQN